MGLSCGDKGHDFRGSEVSSFDMDRQDQFQIQKNAVGTGVEFWPVEHPMEPQDEDRPVKCPIPTSSLINDGNVGEEQCLKKRAVKKENSVTVEAFEPRSVRKRHHAISNGANFGMPSSTTLPDSPSQNDTVFQMLQQLDEFES